MPTEQFAKRINTTATALKDGTINSWAQIGLALDEIDNSDYCENNSISFTEYIRKLAPKLGLKEASLWRYLTAIRYYKQLCKTLTDNDIPCQQPSALPDKVSPENIEILSRLSRAMPNDAFLDIAKQVIAGSITRVKMRKAWQAYRPALDGKTARGKGVEAPKVDPTYLFENETVLVAQVYMALYSSWRDWTRTEDLDCYELFEHTSPEFPLDCKNRFSFDAVAIIRTDKTAPMIFHGIEIKAGNMLNSSSAESLKQITPFCDYLWVAFYEQIAGEEYIPEYVGLLVADKHNINVVRQAQRTKESGSRTCELVKGLLLKTFSR